jgi:2-polyprenyl-6-hydroxyphenyl methylase/3-demethylubiquinone-9 3-methyltransferase
MTENMHAHEIQKFGSMAERWWDLQGEFKTLHAINPLRLNYIDQNLNGLYGKQILDIGCGGGILTEALAKKGSEALGIDLSDELIDIAELHALETDTVVRYQKISAETLATQRPNYFDAITCMEMLEHVPDPGSIIAACAQMVKPGGLVFFSTLNRKTKAFLLAIVAAEYLLRIVPRGTHDYKTFIKPSELSRTARSVGLDLKGIVGVQYNPFTQQFSLGRDVDVNYIAVYKRQA